MVRVYHPHIFKSSRSSGCQMFSANAMGQCGIHWIRGPFCPRHENQSGKCVAIKRNGLRCLENLDPAGRGNFCVTHCGWATPDEVVCQGKKLDGKKCFRRCPIDGYAYCEWQHDPRVEYYSPTSLRLDWRTLAPSHTDQDRYNPGRSLFDDEKNQIDHVDELQQMTFAFSLVEFADSEEKDNVVDFARDELMNKKFNLCRTLEVTNGMKGEAVTAFLGDVMIHSMTSIGRADLLAVKEVRDAAFNVPIVTTFTDHLRARGLNRDSARLISQEMKTAMTKVVHTLSDQGETPIYDVLASATVEIGQAMGLLGSQRG